MITKLVSLAVLFVLAFACAHHRDSASRGAAMITGTVSYRERVALPPGATIRVTLEDVSLADAPSETIGATALESRGRQVPIPFEIAFDPSKVDQGHTYSVRARIVESDGALAWTSTRAYPVLTRGAGSHVDVTVERVEGARAASGLDAAARAAEGRTWVLERFEQDGGIRRVPEGVRITARFEGGRVSGSAGCNRYHGPFSFNEGATTVGPLATTRMACPEPVAGAEAAFLGAMGSAKAAHLDGEVLTIAHDHGTLVFREEPPTRLPGTAWNVVGYNNGKQAVVSVLLGTELTLEFREDAVAGSAGCNTFQGTCVVEGGTIRVGPLMAAQKMCVVPEGVMDQEGRFLAALEQAATWRVDGDTLELIREDGGRLVTAQRR